MKKKKNYNFLDVVRVISCILVLFYHLNILKGGFLAVCIFFVLSGYLSCTSLFNKKKISLKDYYLNKLKKIYLPLLIVVFVSLVITKLFPNILWLNLKPESLSVIFGYNNIWQLNANMDYFSRHISSPFMHFWYISILLQFDLVFPFIFLLLKKLSDKISKFKICLFLGILTLISICYFLVSSYNANIMVVYYSSLTRLFSLMIGVFLGFINHYYKPLVSKKLKKYWPYIFCFYLIVVIALSIFIESNSNFFALSMVFISIISCRLIDYALVIPNIKNKKVNNILKYLSNISYELYLFQYPVIFFFQDININYYLKIVLIILITFILSILLHFSFSKIKVDRRKRKKKFIYILKYTVLSIFIILSGVGLYVFIITPDHTMEMKALEDELQSNSLLMEKMQKEYRDRKNRENDEWQNKLNDLEISESELGGVVSSLNITGIGDSVMLGALNNLYARFYNSYFDAKISRTDWEANGILNSLKSNGMLGDIVVFNLGANGSCGDSCRNEIINTCEGREIYWVNVTNDYSVHVNDTYNEMANNYNNVHVIDWNSYSSGHPEYFVADGIHLTDIGREAYTNCIYDTIYNVYLERFNIEKQKVIDEHNSLELNKYSFIGNDLLLNIYNELNSYYDDIDYSLISNNDFNSLYSLIQKAIDSDRLNYNVVFIFDSSLNLNESEFLLLINLLDNHKIYFINISDRNLNFMKNNDIIILDLYKEVMDNNYLMADGIHLTLEGNKFLFSELRKIVK